MQTAGHETTVLDNDLNMINLMRRFGFQDYFGDPTRPGVLHAAGLEAAKVLVVSLDDKHAAVELVKYARRERPDLRIVAPALDRIHVYELFRAGANGIVREMFDSSLRAGRYALENLGTSDFEAHEFERLLYKEDRRGLRDLAPLWDPDFPVENNQAHNDRALDLNGELGTNIVQQMQEKKGY